MAARWNVAECPAASAVRQLDVILQPFTIALRSHTSLRSVQVVDTQEPRDGSPFNLPSTTRSAHQHQPPARSVAGSPPAGPAGITAQPRLAPPAALRDGRAAAPPLAGRISLAHDYLLVMRGAERVFAAIADLYADAPIYTLLHDPRGTGSRFSGHAITTSPLQRLGVDQSSFRRLLPLYPAAVRRLKLPESDVVLSSSSAFAHGVRVPHGTVHVSYCHAPFRYAWDEQDQALREIAAPLRPLLRRQLRHMRRWDRAASARVHSYIANSQLTRERIKRYYRRDAPVIHPPVETHRFAPGQPGDALLVVSEILRHKRLHVALEAARRARTPIQVVGAGPHQGALRDAYPEAQFLGRVSDAGSRSCTPARAPCSCPASRSSASPPSRHRPPGGPSSPPPPAARWRPSSTGAPGASSRSTTSTRSRKPSTTSTSSRSTPPTP